MPGTDETTPTRTCRECGQKKPLTKAHFYVRNKKTGNMSLTCIDCQKRIYRERNDTPEGRARRARRQQRYRARHGQTDERSAFRIIRDPDKLGGFPPGAVIPYAHVVEGLRQSCFTPGTILRNKYQYFRVQEGFPEQLVVIPKDEVVAPRRV